MELNKNNYKRFTRSNMLPTKNGEQPTDSTFQAELVRNTELLAQCKKLYEAGSYRREREDRDDRYADGDQLSDLIQDTDGCGFITEREYITKRGKLPIIINKIAEMVNAVVGVFCGRHLVPLALSRNVDRKMSGRVLTGLLKAWYEKYSIQQKDIKGFHRTVRRGLVCFRTGYEYDSRTKTSDVKLELVDNNRLFFDDNTSGDYFENISIIGVLHDWTITDVLKAFAHSANEGRRIESIYKSWNGWMANTRQQYRPENVKRDLSFLEPETPDKCRVIEVWRKEGLYTYHCHDIKTGEEYFVDQKDIRAIDAENDKRINEAVKLGVDPSEALIIDHDNGHYDYVWTFRYLTPNGYVLEEGITPYEHGEHPFTIGQREFADGKRSSLVELAIPTQRMINTLVQRIEFQRMTATKGLTIIDKRALQKSGVSEEEALSQIARSDGFLSLDLSDGVDPIRQYKADSSNAGDMQSLQYYMDTFDSLTGNHGALRGEQAKANTPAALYEQQYNNSQNNIAELINWYSGLLTLRNFKVSKVMMQYYMDEEERMVRIVGEDGRVMNMLYHKSDMANLEWDMFMTESPDSGPTYAANEDKLYNFALNGMISPKVYFRSSADTYAEKVLENIEAEEKETEQKQMEMQQQAIAAQQAQQQQIAAQAQQQPQQQVQQ